MSPAPPIVARTTLCKSVLACVACGAVALGCATGDDSPGGGGDNLPTARIVPWSLSDEPIVVWRDDVDLDDPWAVGLGDDDVRIYLAVVAESSAAIGIASATRADDNWTFALTDESLFEAELPWENDRVRGPTVVAGDDEHPTWHMVYEGGDDLGWATSVDGLTWTRSEQPLLTGVRSPSLVRGPDSLRLFFVTDDGAVDVARVVPEATGALASVESRNVLGTAVSSAGVRAVTTPVGRTLYRTMFVDEAGIGFAGAFEDLVFTHFEQNPLLEADGFDPSRIHEHRDWLLHGRNERRKQPARGRGIALAWFGDTAP